MWHLVEDFFEQNLLGKAFVGLGWLAVLIMATSCIDSVRNLIAG